MLTSLHIENFKRFRSLEISPIRRVNLISGRNNVGKTAVLEAIALLLDGKEQLRELPKLFRNAESVGRSAEIFWRWLFRAHQDVQISGEDTTHQMHRIRIDDTGLEQPLPESSPLTRHSITHDQIRLDWLVLENGEKGASGVPVLALPVQQSNPQLDAFQFDRVVLKRGAEERLQKLLKIIEPRLESLRTISTQGAPLIYADIGLDERIPAVHLGQGFNRLLSIYASILASGKKVLLIDEIENGLHHEILPEVWRGIRALAESEDVQVFATTHSWEAVAAAHEAFAETIDYDFALHRLVQVGDDIRAQTLDREGIEASVRGLLEVR
jgi:hypothetical protein